ncbi:lipoyl(octanoyl) transferase LipB [Simiduia sp. 21SJ11W-1]|uniref:lipoyl(octanoyl) transferase LipB n=1 Tax=Simiduia sp. 21SJ11W-1 TaxID=2909669 RepID=UPI00209E2878|nr:lipoyl(octanoyl) transferase LipB [Simiduia sp. 21SJ11W-1]UTA48702.1 lipoyl(octanoyl) transferase LipB [Simiduia sp. 21SJ11W-1]
MSQAPELIVRWLGSVPYEPVWRTMSELTTERDDSTVDELWLLEHPPVFTQGQAGKAEHLLMPGDIPVVKVDRGGQVTYHGPGQLVGYPLIDIKRRGLGVRDLVTAIEQLVVDTVASYGVSAYPKADAPGVYVDLPGYTGAKIASLGLRVRKHRSYHGLALNVDMDLAPFGRINPCGYQGLQMTQLADLSSQRPSVEAVAQQMATLFTRQLGYTRVTHTREMHPNLQAALNAGHTHADARPEDQS